MHLTVGYLTSREEPKFEWFAAGLVRELASLGDQRPEVQVIVVDTRLWYVDPEERRASFHKIVAGRFDFQHVPPKPSVLQGPNRLTQHDYFCAANARNTVFCLSRGEHVVFVDDLSVLMPGWASGHLHAAIHKYVMAGTTTKHKNLVVDEQGQLVSFEPFLPGIDSRLRIQRRGAYECGGQWLFGGTFSVPLDAALFVNGQDEIYDGIGGEDYDLGIRLERAGYKIYFSSDCGTVESEELHHGYEPMIRLDKSVSVDGPYSSNTLYYRLMRSTGTWTMSNHYVLRELRNQVLSGEPFPVMFTPERHWVDDQPLSEM